MLEASPYYYYASLVIAIVCGAIFGVGFPAVYRSLVGAPQSIAEHSDEKKQHNSNGQKRGASHTTTQLKGGESELPSVSTTIRKSERLPSVQSHLAAAPPPNFEGSSVMLRCSQGGASSYPISSNSPAATMGLSTTCRLVVVVGPPFTSTSTANKEVGSGLGNDHQREGGVKGESLPSVVDEGAFIRLVLVSRTLTLYAVQEKDEYVRRSTLAAEDALKIGSVDRVAKTPTHHSIKTGSHDILDKAKSDKLKNNIEKERDEEDRSRRPAGRHLLPSDTFIGRITLSSTRVSSITLVMPREVGSTDTDAANSSGYGVVLKVREEGGREEGRGLLDTLSALRRGGATGSLLQQASSVAWRECCFSFETYREACRWYNALHDTLMNSSKGARAAKKDGGERSTGVEKEEEKEEEDHLAMWGEALNRFINARGAVPLGEHSSDLTSILPFSRSAASSVAAALATRIVFGTNGWDSCRDDYSQPIETAFTKSFNRYARESLVSKQRIFDSHSQKSDGTVTKKGMATPSSFLVDESVTDDPLLVVLPKHIQKRKRLHNGIKKLAGASQSSEAEESDTNEEGNVIAAMRLVKMRACGRGSQSLARQYGLTQVAAHVQRSHACVPSARFYELQRQNNKKDDISCPTTNSTELSNAKYRRCRGDDEQDGEKFFAVAPSVREVNFDLGIASVASHPFIELIVKVFLYNSSLSNSNTARPCDGENKEEEPLFSEPLYAYVKLEDLDGIVRTNISSPTVPDGDAYTDVKRVSTPELWFGFCGRPASSVTCELISPATHSLVYRDVGSLDDEGIGRALSAYEQAVTLLAAAKEAPLSSLESRIADEVFEALFAEVTLPHYGSLPMPTLISAQQMGSLDTASTTSIATKSQRQTQELIEMWTKESLQLMSAFTEAQSCLHYARCEALYAEATQRSAPQKGGFAVTLSEEHPPSSICAAQTISSTPPPHQTLGIHASLSTIELNIKAPLSSSASDLVQNLRRREESLRLALAEAKAAGAREHARRLEEAAKNDERRKAETHKNQERMAELEKRLQQEREKESARKHQQQQHFQSQQEQCAQARESSVDSSSGVVARKLLLTSQQRATDGEEVSAAVKPTTAPPPAALTNASLIDEVTATRIQNTERAITLLSETLQKLADRPPPLPAAVPIVTYSPALTPRYRHKSKGSGRPQSRLRGRHRAASPSSRSSSFSSSSPSSSSFEEEDGGVKGTDDNYDRGDSDAAVDHFELSTPKSSHVRCPTKEERRQAEKDKRNKKEGRKEEQNAKNNTPPPSTHLAAKNSSRKSTSPSASSSRSKGKAKGKMGNGKESEDDAEKISKQRPPPPPPTILLDEAAAKQLFLSLQQEQREKEEAGKALREKAEEEEEERVTRVKRRQLEEEERREKELVLMRERERVREEEKERAQRAFASTIQQLEDRLGREIAASRRREEEEDARHRRREAELASQIKAMQEQQNELQKAIKSANALGDHVRDREHQLQQTEASLKALQANLQEERNAQSALTKQRLAEEEARRAREELLKKELELKAKADAERLELTRKELEELKERTIASQAMAEERRRAEEAEKAKSKESEQEAQARLKEAEDAIISLQAQIIRSQTPPSSVSVASFSMVPPSRYSHDMIQGMGNLTTPRRHSSRVRVPSVHNTDGGLGSGRNAVASSPYDRYSSPVLDASVDNHSDPDNIDFLNSEYYSRRESVYSSSVAFPRGHSKLSAFSGGGSSVPHQNQQQGQQGRAYGTPPLTPRTNRQPLVNTNRDNHAKISSANDRNEHKDSKSRPRSRSNTIDNESVVEGGEGVTNIHEETGKAVPPRRLRKSKLRTDEEGGNEVDGDEYGSTAGEGDQSDYEYQRHEYVGRDPSVPRTIDGFTTTGTDGTKEECASPSFDFMQNYLCKVLGGAIVSNRLDVEGITAVPASSSSSSSEVEKESAIVKASSTTKACPLEVDDMLLSCNGAPLHTLSQLYEATMRLAAGGGGGGSDDARVLVLSCFRGGDVVDVEIAVTSEIS